MNSLQEAISSWATILGTVYNLLTLIQSGAWLATIGILFAGFSAVITVYARREHTVLEGAGISIGGRSLDSLNVANLRRRVTCGVVVQEAHYTAAIFRDNLSVVWKYTGYSASEHVASIEFSIDADSNIPFDELDCFAYDLQNDPDRVHKIRPVLVGEDGISKKIAVPLLAPLAMGQSFAVRLECALPGCMNTGVDYCTSTLSFKQDQTPRCSARLIFIGNRPSWVRVYEVTPQSQARLIKDLRPVREDSNCVEYFDAAANFGARSATVFTFLRSPAENWGIRGNVNAIPG